MFNKTGTYSPCSSTGITPQIADGGGFYLESDDDEDCQRKRSSASFEAVMSPSKSSKKGEAGLFSHVAVNLNDEGDEDTPCNTDENRDTGVGEYNEFCVRFSTTPVSKFVKDPRAQELNLKHRGFGDRGAQALAVVIEVNVSQKVVSAFPFHLTQRNKYIRSLIIDDNNIKKEGGAAVLDSCGRSRALLCLDMSNNKLGDLGPDIGKLLSTPSCTVIDLRFSG